MVSNVTLGDNLFRAIPSSLFYLIKGSLSFLPLNANICNYNLNDRNCNIIPHLWPALLEKKMLTVANATTFHKTRLFTKHNISQNTVTFQIMERWDNTSRL